MSGAAVALAASAVAACAVGLAAAACSADPPAGLADLGRPMQVSGASRPGGDDVLPVPSADDSHAAVPDLDPNRTVSPAQGPVRLTVHAAAREHRRVSTTRTWAGSAPTWPPSPGPVGTPGSSTGTRRLGWPG